MLSISLIKLKLLAVLSMVFMGLFSRLVLGLPLTFPSSSSIFHNQSEPYRFPEGGARTSMRFILASRIMQKRRRKLANGDIKEDEIFTNETDCEKPKIEFIGDLIEHSDTHQRAYS